MPMRRLVVACTILCGLMGCSSLAKKRDAASVLAGRKLTMRGMDSLARSDYPAAEEWFRQAIESAPNDERARYQYAKILWQRRAYRQAVQQMQDAAQLSGNAPDMMVELGHMYLATGEIDSAARSAQAAIASDARHAGAHELLGDVLRELGRCDEALEHYHRAIDVDEDLSRVKLAAAEVYRQMNAPRRALATLQTVSLPSLTATDQRRLLLLRGLAQKDLRRYRDAAACLELVRSNGPPDPFLLDQLAECYVSIGDFTTARQTAEASLQLIPQYPPALALLARLDESSTRMAALNHDESPDNPQKR